MSVHLYPMAYRFKPMSNSRGLELAAELASVATIDLVSRSYGADSAQSPLSGLRDRYIDE